MLRKFISDLAFIQVLNLLIKPVWILIIDRAVQNILGQGSYGQYFALLNFSLIFFIVLDLGITSFNASTVSKDPKKFKSLFGNLFGLKIVLAVLYVLLVFIFGTILGYDSKEFSLLLLLCVVQILTSFNQYFRSSISAFQMFKWDGVFMVGDRLISIILCAFLIWGDQIPLNIENFIWAQILGLFGISILLVSFIYYKLDRINLSFSLKGVFPLLRKTWPYGLLIALMGLFNYLDGVMIKSISPAGDEEAGVYAMGYRLFFALFMFAQIFSNVLLSMYGKWINDKQRLFKLSMFNGKLLSLGAVTIGIISWFYREEVIRYLYPGKFSEDAGITFGLLMFSFIGSAIILVYGTLMTAKEQLSKLNWAAFITLIINVILNFNLIPDMGAKGAAIATLSTQLAFGIACIIITHRSLKFRYPKGEIWRIVSGFGLLILGSILILQYLQNMLVHASLILTIVIFTAWLMKLWDPKSLNSPQ
ncbi:oligosaccharide flippase family protein [bacterium]|nr:oligosaccharide flippase family protein [bacterium]